MMGEHHHQQGYTIYYTLLVCFRSPTSLWASNQRLLRVLCLYGSLCITWAFGRSPWLSLFLLLIFGSSYPPQAKAQIKLEQWEQEYAHDGKAHGLNTRRENELFTGSALVVNNHPKTPFYRAQHNTRLHHQKMGRFNSMLYRIHGLPKKKTRLFITNTCALHVWRIPHPVQNFIWLFTAAYQNPRP